MTRFATARVETELGPLFVAATGKGVCFLKLSAQGAEEAFDSWASRHLPAGVRGSLDGLLGRASEELDAFARGDRRVFETPLDLRGTDFQRAVWVELARIPYGQTRTYAQVARSVGNPGASRAVGMANHRNPVPILVPCHRVVASNGMGGFGAGAEWKRRLLALEGALLPFGG